MSGFLNLGLGFGVNQPVAAGGGGSSFDPAVDLATDPLLINPVSDNVTKDGSNRISNILATGTVGANWAQGTAGLQPLWVADAGGGKPGITFEYAAASTDFLGRSDAALNAYLSANTDAFAICVVSFSGVTQTKEILRMANGRMRMRRTATAVDFVCGGGFVAPTVTVAGSTRYIIAGRRLAGKVGVSLNGGAWTELTDTTPDITTAGEMRLSNNAGGDESLTMQLMNVKAAYPGDTEYAALVANLQTYFGLS